MRLSNLRGSTSNSKDRYSSSCAGHPEQNVLADLSTRAPEPSTLRKDPLRLVKIHGEPKVAAYRRRIAASRAHGVFCTDSAIAGTLLYTKP